MLGANKIHHENDNIFTNLRDGHGFSVCVIRNIPGVLPVKSMDGCELEFPVTFKHFLEKEFMGKIARIGHRQFHVFRESFQTIIVLDTKRQQVWLDEVGLFVAELWGHGCVSNG